MASETLEPCPFCGGDAHWCPTYIDADEPGTVTCANGCGATVICSGDKATRIAAWNRRAAVAELVEALAEFAKLEIPKKPEGNAGFYSIPFKRIERAQEALSRHQAGLGKGDERG